jgi:hypothetical protein
LFLLMDFRIWWWEEAASQAEAGRLQSAVLHTRPSTESGGPQPLTGFCSIHSSWSGPQILSRSIWTEPSIQIQGASPYHQVQPQTSKENQSVKSSSLTCSMPHRALEKHASSAGAASVRLSSLGHVPRGRIRGRWAVEHGGFWRRQVEVEFSSGGRREVHGGAGAFHQQRAVEHRSFRWRRAAAQNRPTVGKP